MKDTNNEIMDLQPVPCKVCGSLPAIWVIDKYVIRFKPDKNNSGKLRDYVDTAGHRKAYKIRCTGRFMKKKNEQCHKSSIYIRKTKELAIQAWNADNTPKTEGKSDGTV